MNVFSLNISCNFKSTQRAQTSAKVIFHQTNKCWEQHNLCDIFPFSKKKQKQTNKTC